MLLPNREISSIEYQIDIRKYTNLVTSFFSVLDIVSVSSRKEMALFFYTKKTVRDLQ